MTAIKRLSATFFSLLVILTALIPLSAGAEKDFSNCRIYDEYDVFKDDKLEELNGLIEQTAEEIDMYIAVYISKTDLDDLETERFSEQCYEDIFGENTDGVFFYMDLSGGRPAYDYISTSGMGALVYTDYRNDGESNIIDKMFDQIYNYMPSSGEIIDSVDIELAIEEFCRQLEIYAEKGAKSFYYSYDSADGKYIYESGGKAVVSGHKPFFVMIKYLPVGMLCGIVIALIMFFSIKSTYKFKKSCDSSVYVERNETDFTVRDDRFIRQYTTKTKIESSSSSGGSHHSGGGSHGGGSHGGGGRHR